MSTCKDCDCANCRLRLCRAAAQLERRRALFIDAAMVEFAGAMFAQALAGNSELPTARRRNEQALEMAEDLWRARLGAT